MDPQRIVFFHLLNDYSGSPKALLSVIEEALAEGYSVELYTSSGGPLDSLSHPRLRRHVIPYRFRGRSAATVASFIGAQAAGFFAALRYAFSRRTSFYVNTILPVGATIGAWLTRRPLTIHCHEYPASKSRFYRLLSRLTLPRARKVICVSAHQAAALPQRLPIEIRPNRLPADFLARLKPNPPAAFERKNILMLASLKPYKGIREFIKLAAGLPQFNFTLVLSAPQEEIDRWLHAEGIAPTPNVTLHPCQSDVAPMYNEASVVLNLSDPAQFIETSGLTVLEARACRLPVIVPTVGGITECITDGTDGYHIDSQDIEALTTTLRRLLSDRSLYLRIAAGVESKKSLK